MVTMRRVDQTVAGGMSAGLQMAYSISEICAAGQSPLCFDTAVHHTHAVCENQHGSPQRQPFVDGELVQLYGLRV
jgi:hypothetical protein